MQSLFLASVSIKPNSVISGFTILRRLVMEFVKILGDFPGLLAKCSGLEDLEIIGCYGVDNLIVPHKLDKLQHLLIAGMDIQMVEFHATDLAHFEYKGRVIPIVLHGCSKLEKATMKFNGTKALAHAFTAVPSILPVKALHLQAFISKYAQVSWSFCFFCSPHSSSKLVLLSASSYSFGSCFSCRSCQQDNRECFCI